MDISTLIQGLVAASPVAAMVFGILGALVVIGQMIVQITPSTADDAAWAKIKAQPIIGPILTALVNFAPWHKP